MATESATYFIFRASGMQCAVDVADVVEIIEVDEVLPFHGELEGCLGNLVHREKLVPLFDSAALTANLPRRARPPMAVVLTHSNVVFALTLDDSVAVHAFDDESEDSTVEPESHTKASKYIDMIRGFEDASLAILDVPVIGEQVRGKIADQTVTEVDPYILTREEEDDESDDEGVRRIEGSPYMCVGIEKSMFAIPMEGVLEVVEGLDVTPLFKVRSFLRGIINLRGKVLACVDISSFLSLPQRVLEERNKFIVLQDGEAELAFCVDHVIGLRHLLPERMERAETVFSGEFVHYVNGVLEDRDETIYILSVSSLFESSELAPYRSVD